MSSFRLTKIKTALSLVAVGATMLCASAAHAWEPTKTVEFVVPAGTGGGADQMARLVQGIVTKHKLLKSSMVVVNKGGGAGAEGFLEMKNSKGDPHKIIITLSNLFTTPVATGVVQHSFCKLFLIGRRAKRATPRNSGTEFHWRSSLPKQLPIQKESPP